MSFSLKKFTSKHIVRVALWSLGSVLLFVLLLSAMSRNSSLKCSEVEIVIDGYNHEMFISEAEVKRMLNSELQQKIKGSAIETLDLKKIEKALQKNAWISKSQLFIDNRQVLHVNIGERMPVARVFSQNGESFYMDSSSVVLPLSDNEVADVPVFTNVPNSGTAVGKNSITADSLVWSQVSAMGNFIKRDSFLLMQIGQIDFMPNRTFIMYPAIGNHVIYFGNADNYENKLRRLSIFYKKIFGKVGLNKYGVIDLRYDKQIVATLRGKQSSAIDSLQAVRTFEALVNKTAQEANDTSLSSEPAVPQKIRPEVVSSKTIPLATSPQQAVAQEVKPKTVKPVVRQVAPQKPVVKPVVQTVVKPKKIVLKDRSLTTQKETKQKPVIKKTTPAINTKKPVVKPKAVQPAKPKKNDY